MSWHPSWFSATSAKAFQNIYIYIYIFGISNPNTFPVPYKKTGLFGFGGSPPMSSVTPIDLQYASLRLGDSRPMANQWISSIIFCGQDWS